MWKKFMICELYLNKIIINKMRYTYTHIGMAKIYLKRKKFDITKCWQGCKAIGTFIQCCGKCKIL